MSRFPKRAWRLATCVHFAGIGVERCRKEIEYDSVMIEAAGRCAFPCVPPSSIGDLRAECLERRLPTPEELDAEDARAEREDELLAKGLSFCCEAPLDERRVILEGRRAGHGPRLCSECGKIVFVV